MKRTIVFASLLLFGTSTLIWMEGCDSSSQPSASGNKKFFPLTVPTLGTSYYGQLAIHGGTGKVALTEYSDPTLNTNTITLPTTTSAAGYFGDGDAVTSLSVNGTSMPSSGTGTGLHYWASSPTLYTDGTTNTFSWISAGTSYSSSIGGNIGSVAISAPLFNTTVSKSANLTVSWTTSSDPDDYCSITIQGKQAQGSLATTTSYYQVYCDDNGSCIIPSSVLSTFTEGSATITLNRGKFLESTVGGHPFFTTMYTSDQIDVSLS